MLGHGTPLKMKMQGTEQAFVAEFLFVQWGSLAAPLGSMQSSSDFGC